MTVSERDYLVELDVFRGPLDLLLYLVKRDEVDIRDIPIARVAEQFKVYLDVVRLIDVERAGDFLVMSATLMEIKSKLLLPRPESSPAEEDDPRKELVRQLLEYKRFKEVSALLEVQAEQQQRRLARQPPAVNASSLSPAVRPVELWDLVSAFGRLMRETMALQPQQIVLDYTPIHIYMEQIVQRLEQAGRLPFADLFTPPFSRGRLVGLFLAVLELVKSHQILAEQPDVFGAIWVVFRPREAEARQEPPPPEPAPAAPEALRRNQVMREFLARRWFLLLLAAAIGLALLWPRGMHRLVDRVPDRLVVILSLFLMAWSLPIARLLETLRRPAAALWAVVISFGLLPGLAWLLSGLLPRDDLRVGLMICASVPCTLSSAVIWTRLAGGNDASAMLATVLSAGTGWLATSWWLTAATEVATRLSARTMMEDLLLVLVVPVGVGQLVRLSPRVVWFTVRHRTANGVAARLLVCVMLVKGVLTAAPAALALTLPVLALLFVLCWGLHLVGIAAGLYGGRLLRLDRPDCIAAAIAGSQKTLPVGLYLFQTYFQDQYPLALAPLVFYHASQMVLDTLIAERLRPRETSTEARDQGRMDGSEDAT